MNRPPRVRRMKVEEGRRPSINISQYPNFCATGSVKGMRKIYGPHRPYLVKCGSYIYNVPESVYYQAN